MPYAIMLRGMKWVVRVITKRQRKQALRIRAKSIDELARKLSKHVSKIQDLQIETPPTNHGYWKSLIMLKLFKKTHAEDTTPTLF